jgi:hypothetical protein
MESLHWENHNSSTFNVFIRDLSQGNKVNLKWMIEDLEKKQDPKDLKDLKKGIKQKKKIIKKKDIIIQEQNKIREKKLVDDDLQKIEFLFRNLNDKNIYDNFDNLKTSKGKQTCKLKLLCHFIEKQKDKLKKTDYMPHILNLYFNLKYGEEQYLLNSDEYLKLSNKLDKKLEKYDYKTYMMKELSHLLPPLNFWSKGISKLDEWQANVISEIKAKKSVLVKAPTSAGKTFVAMATGLIHNKILYVCPAKPVAYQVGAGFIKMGYKVHYLVENMGHLSYDSRTNIFVGTPDIIEKYLPKIGTTFDYAVFDEIHNLNESIAYENIIKLCQCNFLALSATIENIDFLREIFQRIHPHKEIKYVEYKKRFINQQRWVYGDQINKINKIHPISCLDVSDFKSFENISFTPNDCIVLYEMLEEVDDDDFIESINPDNYFKTWKLLTLDDTKEYEQFMKDKLKELYQTNPDSINSIIYKFQNSTQKTDLSDIIPFFKECKKEDLLPMLYFHTDEKISHEIALKVYQELQDQEIFNYPFHYQILEKKDELYKKYLEKREVYSDSIKIKTNDARTEKEEKMNKYDKEQRDKYISDMREFYERCSDKCKSLDNSKKCISHLKKELSDFIVNPDFRIQDIFKKHPDYCFSRGEPMSGQEIKKIRREIKKAIGSTISYENPVFQLLKRGIGLYISSMPDEYNWILQRLMSEKKLGIVISDRTLCLGIDLPIRSVALSGYKNPKYTTSDYLQMSGRAGRRGHDNQGNIIFHGVSNYLDLMKGELPKLIGSSKKLGESYSVIKDINKNISIDNLSWRIDSDENEIRDTTIPIKIQKLAWSLRYYEKSFQFLNEMNKMEKKIFIQEEEDREYWFYLYIIKGLFNLDEEKYLMIYKKNKIEEYEINDILPNLIQIASVHQSIVNTLDNTFMITKKNSEIIFLNLKTLIYKYRGFE